MTLMATETFLTHVTKDELFTAFTKLFQSKVGQDFKRDFLFERVKFALLLFICSMLKGLMISVKRKKNL